MYFDDAMNQKEPMTSRFQSFELNCSVGDHRSQRLQFVRDGTQSECLQMGHNKNPQFYAVQKNNDNVQNSLSSEQETKAAHVREKRGELVKYPLPTEVYEIVASIDDDMPFATFDVGEVSVMSHPITLHDMSMIEEFYKRTNPKHCFFDSSRNYIHLHDSFPLEIVRSVFTLKELLRMKHTSKQRGRILFLLQSVTQHLAPNPGCYVLCEVDFERMRIVFYYSLSTDNYTSLAFYVETMWNQFVSPAQQKQWKASLFILPDSFLSTMFLVLLSRMSNKRVSVDQFQTMTSVGARAGHAFTRIPFSE